jgi:hypothetical protein
MEKGQQATHAFAFYCFLVAIYLSIGGLLQYRFGLLGISINEIFLLAVPAILYAKLRGLSLKKTFPISKPSFEEVLLVILLTALVIAPIAILVHLQENLWPLPEKVEAFYKELLFKKGLLDILFKVLVLAIVPAICEEFFFRGLLQSLLVPFFGKWKGILLVSFFFALAHLNPWYFLYYFLLGIYLSWLRNYKNNLALCILAHLANNLYSLF